MTYKESIIANIAFRAGEFVSTGDIRLGENLTFDNLTQNVLKLADQFFEKYPETFFRDGELNFAEEIYEFTRKGFNVSSEHELVPGTEIEDTPKEAEIYLLSGGGTRRLFHSGSYQECLQVCEAMDWRFFDENEFAWELELEKLREHSLISVCPVTIIRVRDWENRAWSDDFYVDVTKTISEETFKAAIQDYLNTAAGQAEIEKTNEDFNWGDAVMYVPEDIWNKHGIYSAPQNTSPSALGLTLSSEHPHVTLRVNQDEILIPDSYYEQKEDKKWNKFEELLGEPLRFEEYQKLNALCGVDLFTLSADHTSQPFIDSFRNNLDCIRSNADEMEYVTPCIKVEWVNCDEGLWGDYNENNPEDINLLRFDVSVLVDGEWEAKEDASYCTQFPADTSIEEKIEALRCIGKEYHDALKDDPEMSVKKLGERLSWISPETLPSKITAKQSLERQIQSANQRKTTPKPNMEVVIER